MIDQELLHHVCLCTLLMCSHMFELCLNYLPIFKFASFSFKLNRQLSVQQTQANEMTPKRIYELNDMCVPAVCCPDVLAGKIKSRLIEDPIENALRSLRGIWFAGCLHAGVILLV
jgi:hypothetical protein